MTDSHPHVLGMEVHTSTKMSNTIESTPETVLEVALKKFAELGFNDTRLEAIAKESGMSKRMIHYHFGDKKGLYQRCLVLAIKQLRPTITEMELDSGVPGDGVQKIVEAVYYRYANHPEAVRLLLVENLMNHASLLEGQPLADQSSITLQLDKLLMQGQDMGAFRPGISAQDIFTLIASIAMFRVTVRNTTINLYNIDMMDDANTTGMAHLAVDTVLAFLTSHIRSRDQISYVSMIETGELEEVSADSAYDISPNLFL